MRSPREILFRLKQETRNVHLLAFPPRFGRPVPSPLSGLPDPRSVARSLSGTGYAAETVRLADRIAGHQFPLFGRDLETGYAIEWRRDYRNRISSPLKYLRLIPYLDAARVGDHKNIWELNRHQHLVVLAQAYLFTGNASYLNRIFEHFQDWQKQNPFERGINWTSALEAAFRAFSWLWVYHLVGSEMPDSLRAHFLTSLYQHGCHIENNLSFYFSPNTHLLGEAVVLHALGQLFGAFPRSSQWIRLGGRTVDQQMRRQVCDDGSHFEQSTYYHVYALDMFLFHAVLANVSPPYLDKLSRMADFLAAVLGEERSLPFLGDDDGGRFFHPYGPPDRFGRATLASCAQLLNRTDLHYEESDLFEQAAWWMGRTQGSGHAQLQSRLFPGSGIAAMYAPGGRVLVDAGPFGPGRAGHSHSDTLSIVASAGGLPILMDSGTYTYVGSIESRNAFRGSGAHNTVRIDGQNQAVPTGPFGWLNKPDTRILHWTAGANADCIAAECISRGITHWRMVRFIKPDLLLILDRLDGPGGEHLVEQFWHPASEAARHQIFLGSEPEICPGWQSAVFGEKHAISSLVVRRRAVFPVLMAAAICLDSTGGVRIEETEHGAEYIYSRAGNETVFKLNYARENPASTPAVFASS